jgi:hypothetical protein
LPAGFGVILTASSLRLAEAMRHKFDRIQPGMTAAEVTAVMEADPAARLEGVDEDWYFDIWTWRLGGVCVQIEFTQPPSRADAALPPDAIAVDGVSRVKFKRIAQGSRLWESIKGWYYELIDP